MYFRKLLERRQLPGRAAVEDLLLRPVTVAPRSMTVSWSVLSVSPCPFVAANTGFCHLRHTSVDGPCGSCSQFSDSLERRFAARRGASPLQETWRSTAARAARHAVVGLDRSPAPSLRAAVGRLLEFIMILTPR